MAPVLVLPRVFEPDFCDYAHIEDRTFYRVALFVGGAWECDGESVTWGPDTYWQPVPPPPTEITSMLVERAEAKTLWRGGAPSWVLVNPNQLPSDRL